VLLRSGGRGRRGLAGASAGARAQGDLVSAEYSKGPEGTQLRASAHGGGSERRPAKAIVHQCTTVLRYVAYHVVTPL